MQNVRFRPLRTFSEQDRRGLHCDRTPVLFSIYERHAGIDRRSEILKAARICFLDRGFVRTSLSDILVQSGGSRATVYEAFGSKEGLFHALVSLIIDEMRLPDFSSGEPEVVLRDFGNAYMERLMDGEALGLYRVAVGESAHVRGLGPLLFEAGPKSAATALAKLIQQWSEEGLLAVADPTCAASLFLAMVEGDLHRSAVLWASNPTPEAIAANVDAAVSLFLRGAGALSPSDMAYDRLVYRFRTISQS